MLHRTSLVTNQEVCQMQQDVMTGEVLYETVAGDRNTGILPALWCSIVQTICLLMHGDLCRDFGA